MDGEGLIVPVLLGADHVDIGVYPRLGGGAGAANRFADLLRQGFGKRVKRPLRAVRVGARERSRRRRDAAEDDGEERQSGMRSGEGDRGEKRRAAVESREKLVVVGDGEFQGGPYGHQSNRQYKKVEEGPMPQSLSLSFALFFLSFFILLSTIFFFLFIFFLFLETFGNPKFVLFVGLIFLIFIFV